MKKIKGIAKMDEERISQCVLYLIVALSAIVFLAFYLIGYDVPYSADASFNAPMLTDVLLGFMWGLLTIAIIASIIAVIRGIQSATRSEGITNGIPAKKITYITYGATTLILVLTFIFGSTQMMMVNGQKFTDSFWLRMTDMFINSSLLLLVIAAGVVVFGATRYYRKGHGK
ncbi:hypothetical protein J4856_01075 [Prevotella scopos JCM 17725]|jgi:hypothetical protein|uniref:Uncharacterized protein n=1 Tax=Prevotella scopos JCM 17725 TaxID=1236518 RepID=A0AAX2F739_9BACT|nr:hypothetical protein [Prevotella scopos]ANR74007.1 hypothetical protein AXF22_11320 [Prevotella scopos JCM 17725]QUB44600.1 hypothetical protein J4856_01075 [Prevotella scopos JCM 17725]SHG13954.1 hypothetical protein SAMN05444364_1425 [Prevotella scopos JCM 17725]